MTPQLQRPGAVFFDWDGTLVDSFDLLLAAHNHTRAQFGKPPFPAAAFAAYFGQPRDRLYAELYGKDNIAAAKKHFEAYVYANHRQGVKPMAGSAAVLGLLKDFAVPCGVVTNKKRELVEAEIEHCGWRDFFTSVVGAGEAAADKPAAAPLMLAIERAGLALPAAEIWYAGDTDNDLRCGHAAGVRTILIAPQPQAADLLAKHKVSLHKNNCAEFAEFLLQYGAKPLQK